MASRWNGRYIITFELLFEKSGNCIKMAKNDHKRSCRTVYGKESANYFSELDVMFQKL